MSSSPPSSRSHPTQRWRPSFHPPHCRTLPSSALCRPRRIRVSTSAMPAAATTLTPGWPRRPATMCENRPAFFWRPATQQRQGARRHASGENETAEWERCLSPIACQTASQGSGAPAFPGIASPGLRTGLQNRGRTGPIDPPPLVYGKYRVRTPPAQREQGATRSLCMSPEGRPSPHNQRDRPKACIYLVARAPINTNSTL